MTLPSETFHWLRDQCGPDANYAVQRIYGKPAICCLLCGVASFNSNDIKERYCAACHQFFEFLPSWKEAENEMADKELSPTHTEGVYL